MSRAARLQLQAVVRSAALATSHSSAASTGPRRLELVDDGLLEVAGGGAAAQVAGAVLALRNDLRQAGQRAALGNEDVLYCARGSGQPLMY